MTKDGAITGKLRLTVPMIAVSQSLAKLLPVFMERHPGVEVEVIRGGQPHYRYLIAAE